MAKIKFDSGPTPAPAETSTVPAEIKEANEQVRKGAAADIADRYTGDDAQELFKQLMKDLKEKRQQAKDAGESQADVKAIKFDQLKGTDTYEKWVEASREVEYAGWKEIEQNLRNKLDKAQDAGEDVEQSGGLFEQWEKANARFENISQARKEISHLKDKQEQILVEQARVVQVSERFPGSAPKLVVESNRLAADGAVVAAEVDAVGIIITGGDHSLEGVEADFTMVGDEDLEEEPVEATESFEKKNGTDMIQAFFSKELEKEDKKRISGPKGSLTKKDGFVTSLKDYVGNDGVFATLLLKDANFVKSVRNYFGTEVGVVGKAAETAALQFVHMLKLARTKYDELSANMKVQERVGSEEGEEVEEMPPEIPENLLKISEIEVKIEQLKKQSAKTSFLFGGKERKKIAEQIRDLEKELAGIAENLAASATELVQQASANSDVETLQAVADEATDFNKSVQSGNIRPGSSRFNKYARVIMAAMAGLTFASSVGEVGGRANEEQSQAGSTIKLNKGGAKSNFGGGGMSGISEAQPDAPNGFTSAVDTSEMPTVSPLDGGASEPEPEVAGGFTSAGDLIKPAQDTTAPVPGTYKLKKPGAKGKEGVKIASSVDIGGGEVVVPVAEAVVVPAVASAETAPKREYTSREISEKIEQFSADHPELTAREAGFIQTIHKASLTKGQEGLSLLEAAKTSFLFLNNTSKPKLETFQSFIDGLKLVKDREKSAAPKEGTPSLDEISKKIEKFSADTPNMTDREIELTDLLFRASKTHGKEGRTLLKQARDTFSFVKTSPTKAVEFQSLINDLSEAQKGDQSQIPDLVFSK